VLLENQAERLLVVKGAFEDVLRLSTAYEGEGPEYLRPLDAAARAHLHARFECLGREGFRVLGVAWRAVAPDHPHAVVDDETELVFAGFAAFLDPPKASAKAAVAALTACGVTVKVLTGDNELVTQHVCSQLGLDDAAMVTVRRSLPSTTRRWAHSWSERPSSAGWPPPRRTG
jgi:P-type Mg2+ transporter